MVNIRPARTFWNSTHCLLSPFTPDWSRNLWHNPMWNVAVNNISYPIYPLSTRTEKGYITKMIPFFFCSVYIHVVAPKADIVIYSSYFIFWPLARGYKTHNVHKYRMIWNSKPYEMKFISHLHVTLAEKNVTNFKFCWVLLLILLRKGANIGTLPMTSKKNRDLSAYQNMSQCYVINWLIAKQNFSP